MKLTKTKDKTIKYEDYTIDYENGIVCYVEKRNGQISSFKFMKFTNKGEKRLTYVSNIEPFIKTHWNNHYELIENKKFKFSELENFTEFEKLYYIGGGTDGMLMDFNLTPITTPIILDQIFFPIYEKIETTKEECQKILDSLNKEYLIGSEIQYIPYYNQDELCDDHYTLHLEVSLPQDLYIKALGKEKYVNEQVKKRVFEILKNS